MAPTIESPAKRIWYHIEYNSPTCHCGAAKTRGSYQCVTCYRAGIAADTTARPWYGKTCGCGQPKTEEARQCRSCRYHATGTAA